MNKVSEQALVRNLKRFNAKERDHLMRFAYLGAEAPGIGGDYSDTADFLSKPFDAELQKIVVDRLQSDPSAERRCVFAGMDYHLDWLFAAIWLAVRDPLWDGSPSTAASVPLGEQPEGNPLYSDFRPVMGNQEDVDLLVAYQVGDQLVLLFVEAKGSAVFDRVQLARKLIRLDRILVTAGVGPGCKEELPCLLILAAPTEPKWRASTGAQVAHCIDYAKDFPKGRDAEFEAMKAALEDHQSGIGMGIHYLSLPAYPKRLLKVVRNRDTSDPTSQFSNWTVSKR